MKQKFIFTALIALVSLTLPGCGGSGSAGLNGSISLSARVVGATVVGTVTYVNPTKTDLIGTEITLSTNRPDIFGVLPPFHTNNSGSVNFVFGPVANFDGTQTFTVTATTGNLHDYSADLQMTGRTIAMTPPAGQTIPVTFADTDLTKDIVLDTTPFVTVSDQIGGNIGGHIINITTSVTGTAGSNPILVFPASTTTNSNGVAPLSGAVLTITTPAPGTSATATVTWTAIDVLTGLSASGSTTVTLNRAAS